MVFAGLKNETELEEAAKSHAIYELENNYKPTKESFKLACKRSFIRCAKWQQEQDKKLYSEEEAGELVYNIIGEYAKHYDIMIDGDKLNDLFEQFKKK
jgi:hypothetical protein